MPETEESGLGARQLTLVTSFVFMREAPDPEIWEAEITRTLGIPDQL
jgi:hypothetical protein